MLRSRALVDKYLIPFYQAPDAAVGEAEPATPPPSPENNLAPEPAAADPEPAGEPPAPAPQEHGNKGKDPWFLKRISDETAKRQQAELRAAELEQRARDAEALAVRLQQGGDQPAAPHIPAVTQPYQQDFQTAVQQEAARQRLYDDTLAVRNSGIGQFKDFGDTLNILTAIGATQDDFVLDVLAVDKANAHVILDKLAKDPEKAAALVGMDSRRRTAELVRMNMAAAPAADQKPAAPAAAAPAAARSVSRAPAPPPPVEPSAKEAKDWRSDPNISDAEWGKRWEEAQQAKRAGRR